MGSASLARLITELDELITAARQLEVRWPPTIDIARAGSQLDRHADDPTLVRAMVTAGMDVARINPAHDTVDAWLAMLRNVRDAVSATGSRAGSPWTSPDPSCGPARSPPGRRSAASARSATSSAGPWPRPSSASPTRRGSSVGSRHHRIGCTRPDAIAATRPGHRVALDDGRITGVLAACRPGEIDVEITHCRPQGSRLRAEKGINLPDTEVPVAAITDADLAALAVLGPHVDIVQASFVRTADDVHAVRQAVEASGTPEVGIVVKIETTTGFAHLPEILLAAMAVRAEAVMPNKGPHIELAIETLTEILTRMEGHQCKNRSMLRRLGSWDQLAGR